jgi:hypothetical protein
MVFLGPQGAEIEVRLVKPPFDAEESARAYFDEYEKLGSPHPEKLSHECTRYIIPENTAYAIEITLKKGFDYGDWDGVSVHVRRKVNKTRIGKKDLPKPTDQRGPLPIERKYVVDRINHAVVDGKELQNATLIFRGLNVGKSFLQVARFRPLLTTN